MLTLHDIRVWDTHETIDLIVDGPQRGCSLIETDAMSEGDVDASDFVVAPGLADPHVHFRDPGQTNKETMFTGAQAAASGGYTDVLIMPNTEPAADGVSDALTYLDGYETRQHVTLPVDYRLSICASVARAGDRATDLAQIERFGGLHHAIVAITDDGSAITQKTLDDVLGVAKTIGLPVLEHCEHHEAGVMNAGVVSRDLNVPGIPASTELTIVERDIEAVRRTGAHIHFQHVSTAAAFDAVRKAKAEGLPITCETAPHYLALCDEDVRRYGAMAKMNPPLRSQADRQAALEAVADGTVDMLATDHAPHTAAEKAKGLLGAPNGIIGLETAYGVCHKVLVDAGVINERRLIELMAVAPARLMGCEPTDVAALLGNSAQRSTQRGKRTLDLREVAHPQTANLVVLDNSKCWTIDPNRFHSKARNTPFGGWEVTGMPVATVLGGRLCMSRILGGNAEVKDD